MHTAFSSLFHRLPVCAHPVPCPLAPLSGVGFLRLAGMVASASPPTLSSHKVATATGNP